MNPLEMFGIGSSLVGIGLGFGIQRNQIATLRKNVDGIARMHRETINELNAANIQLAEIRRDIEYLKEKTN
jgi:hypothetical protein